MKPLGHRIKLDQNDKVRDKGTYKAKEHVVVYGKEAKGSEVDPGEHRMEPVLIPFQHRLKQTTIQLNCGLQRAKFN